jgi:hypothetical protein
MKPIPPPQTTAQVTLQTVLDRLAADRSLPEIRRRDLRSAALSFARLKGERPGAIPLDLGDFRQTLDRFAPASARISRKRWANLRSSLASAIQASGLLPMLKTADVKVAKVWIACLSLPTAALAMPFRASYDGRAYGGFAQRASTKAPSIALSQIWMRQRWSGTSALCAARSRSRGTPS